MKRKKLLLLFVLFITIIFTTTGCKQDNMDDIRILVTNYPNEYITQKLYGEHSTVTSVYPDGVDIDEYRINKKQKRDFSNYDLFIYNGLIKKESNLTFDLLDLNSNLSGEQIKLFQNAVIAYKNADLETLKIISSMINTQSLNYENKDSLRLLVKEKERLKMVVKILNEDIIKIKNTYPYTLKTIINDKNKIADKKKEINNVIKQFTHILEVYKSKIEEMVE